jgi:hypothetical protein
MIEVFDNLLTNDESEHIEAFLSDPKFPWFLSVEDNHYTTSKENIIRNSNQFSKEAVLLGHTFYLDTQRNSENYLLSDFILNRFLDRTNIGFQALIRSKANLQMPADTDNTYLYTTPHIDSFDNHKVLIYYANNNDGNTYIFKDHNLGQVQQQIESRKGRFVLFDGDLFHAAGHTKNSAFRLNVNFNIQI